LAGGWFFHWEFFDECAFPNLPGSLEVLDPVSLSYPIWSLESIQCGWVKPLAAAFTDFQSWRARLAAFLAILGAVLSLTTKEAVDMPDDPERFTGLTKATGYQVGARRSLPIKLEAAWELLISPAGVVLWLGEPEALRWEPGAPYRLADGTTGVIRVFKPNSHVRLTWQPPGWARPATIQVRVIPSGDRTVFAFHQEHLPDAAARSERRARFKAALEALSQEIDRRRSR
jgi:uncharacterized protein YndB with AHSA1/START domain